jgi:hypothetical protein
MEIVLKKKDQRKDERITVCAEPELKELWDYCSDHVEGFHVQTRTMLRQYLTQIKEKIETQKKRAG